MAALFSCLWTVAFSLIRNIDIRHDAESVLRVGPADFFVQNAQPFLRSDVKAHFPAFGIQIEAVELERPFVGKYLFADIVSYVRRFISMPDLMIKPEMTAPT